MTKETRESRKKFSVETSQRRKELSIETEKTDKGLRKTRQFFESQWGKLMESLVEGDLVKLLILILFEIFRIAPSSKAYKRKA